MRKHIPWVYREKKPRFLWRKANLLYIYIYNTFKVYIYLYV